MEDSTLQRYLSSVSEAHRNYLEVTGVNAVFKEMISSVLTNTPEDPVKFVASYFEEIVPEIKKANIAPVKEACAFVSLLFGDDPVYALSVAVLGVSLKAQTQQKMILLVTPDVSPKWIKVCESVGWKTQVVEHIPYKAQIYRKRRFAGVFTKLRAIAMETYKKVINLDADLLIRSAIDELSIRDAPAAVRRHPEDKYLDFAEVDGTHFSAGSVIRKVALMQV